MQRLGLVLVLLTATAGSFLSAASAQVVPRAASRRTCPRFRSTDALLDLCPAIEPTDDDLNQALFPEVPLLITGDSSSYSGEGGVSAAPQKEQQREQEEQQQQQPVTIPDYTKDNPALGDDKNADNNLNQTHTSSRDEHSTVSESVATSADLDSPVLLSTSTLLRPETLVTGSSSASSAQADNHQQQQQQEAKTQGPLLSFEEWQRRVLQTENDDRWHVKRKHVGQGRGGGRGYGSAGRQVIDSVEGGIADDLGVMFEMGESQPAANIYDEKEYIEPSRTAEKNEKAAKKQFADVPIKSLKERFNYASIDCAATVRGANKEAKGAQSILHESKDQYMLNKCSAKKYVIINLCEAVLIDTIVMANFEFFSSTFSEFRVWVADRYPTKEWQLLGQWQARNTRDLQVFKVENPIRWFEFIKIEFLSHYGHEYYCPLSLVRVHGMPMMEYYNLVERKGLSGDLDDDELFEDEYLWPAEVREEIIRPKVDALNESDASSITPDIEEDDDMRVQLPIIPPVSDIKDQEKILDENLDELEDALNTETALIQKEITHQQQQQQQQPTPVSSGGSVSKEDALRQADIDIDGSLQDSTTETTAARVEPTDSGTSARMTPSNEESATDLAPDTVLNNNNETAVQATTITTTTSSIAAPLQTPSPQTNNANGAHASDGEAGTSKSTATKPMHANKDVGSSGYTQESIYKTIMKRLNALELNATLSQRYLDEQNKMLNDVFMSMEKQHQEQLIVLISRLNDTASNRIDGMKRRYEQLYEELRQQSELNMKEMTAQMTLLAEQIAFERRVSMAQLVVVITLFVFMALSRGNLSILSPIMEAQAQERKRRESFDQMSPNAKDNLLAPPSLDAVAENRRNSEEQRRRRRSSANSAGLGVETQEQKKQQQLSSIASSSNNAANNTVSVLTRRRSSGDAQVPGGSSSSSGTDSPSLGDISASLHTPPPLPHKSSI